VQLPYGDNGDDVRCRAREMNLTLSLLFPLHYFSLSPQQLLLQKGFFGELVCLKDGRQRDLLG
jgi:hypothetical protein